MKERVLRIPSADPTNTSFVVVKVSHVGPSSLDIRVTGTDGVYPYLALGETACDHLAMSSC